MNLKPLASNMTELELSHPIVGGLPIKVLFSYSTPVAYSDSVGLCYRTSKRWSNTTTRHINQWLAGRPSHIESQEYFYNLIKAGK